MQFHPRDVLLDLLHTHTHTHTHARTHAHTRAHACPENVRAVCVCVQKGRGKPKGPLPMTLVQLLLLAGFGGIGYAVTKEAERTAKTVQAALDVIEKGYNAAEGVVTKYFGKSTETVAAAPRDPSGKDATSV